jgi:adenosylcobinamide-GDP ribazoletransferase
VSGPRAAVAFLTPLGGASAPTPSAFAWFPAVGAGIGALLGVLWWGTEHAWPAPVSAAIVVGGDLALTGLLHFDGLVDSADGLLGHLERERRLTVMREPGIGAFGVAVGAAALLARFAVLSSIRPSILLLTGLWCGSRTVMAVVPSIIPYARSDDGGLATAFLGPGRRRSAALVAGLTGVAGLLCAVLLWRPLGGAIAALSGFAAAALVVVFARRRLGGFTGDVLGAAGVVFETVALIVAAARW